MSSGRPLLCATHPRACSTAFERVFMTKAANLTCLHEPFGDAFYWGPERMSPRFEGNSLAIKNSGYADSTFQTVFDKIEEEKAQGKRLFLKDIIHYWFPPNGAQSQIAPSLQPKRRGIGTSKSQTADQDHEHPPFPYGTQPEGTNPTVIPTDLMKQFHFTFLIRNPHYSIPSYYKCVPRDTTTDWGYFDPAEAGYDEVRRIFDYLIGSGQIGPQIAGQTTQQANGHKPETAESGTEICLVDADDLLDNPTGIMKVYCKSVGLEYSPEMLKWDNQEEHDRAKVAFEKWKGWHDDAIGSTELKARTHKKKQKTEEEWDAEWKAQFGEDAAKLIRDTVDRNMADYTYLRQFAIRA